MTTFTHTPGPWHIATHGASDTGNMLIKPMPGMVVCEIEPLDEALANARLIAAAPELFEALKTINEWSRQHGTDFPYWVVDSAIMKVELGLSTADLPF